MELLLKKKTMEKSIIIENKELKTLLKGKGKLIKKGRVLTDKILKLEKERAEIGEKTQKEKNRIIQLLQEQVKEQDIVLGEFEELGTVDINPKTGKIEVSIFDMIESFKKTVREHKLSDNQKKAGE